MGFIVSLYILKCSSRIIVSLGEIRPLERLPVWEKMARKDGPDWPDKSEGPDRTVQGRGDWIDGSGQWIGSFYWLLRCGGRRESASATNFIGVAGGVEYLCQCSKWIIICCTQIRTAKYYKVLQRLHTIQLYYALLQTVRTMTTYQERTCWKCWHQNRRFPRLHSGTSGNYAKISDFKKNYSQFLLGDWIPIV